MADKEGDYSDEFDESDHGDEAELLKVSKPKVSKGSPRQKNSIKKATLKKSTRRPASPGKTRPGSSASKSARDLWSVAVDGKTTGTSKKKLNTIQAWSDTLRRTGYGISSESGGMSSFSGLKKSQTGGMAYASTSHYLRQMAGTEKPKKVGQDINYKAAPGTPAYKSPEEYYDEILALKKQIVALNNDNSTMKSKLRRIEEDNTKKEKEIEALLDPSKSEELRRSMADRKPDTSTVIHSLKQKILKLEHQLKDRESAYSKLQSDLKNTKVEELRVQMESFYSEILRLNQLKNAGALETMRSMKNSTARESPSKVKALQETILRMNEKNVRLQTETKTLKEDLEKMMEESAKAKEAKKEYEEMNKKELMNSLAKLQQRLDRAEADNLSVLSDVDGRRDDSAGKITLEGSMAQRLDQLDKRETELLEEAEKQRSIIKRLKEDRAHYRKKCDEKDKEIKALKKEIDELQAELNSFYDKDKAPTPRVTPRRKGSSGKRSRSPSVSSEVSRKEERERQRKVKEFTENRAARKIQGSWKEHRHSRDVRTSEEEDEAPVSARKQQGVKHEVCKDRCVPHQQQVKVDLFRKRRAAKVIQKGWRAHKQQEEEQQRMRRRDSQIRKFQENRAAKAIQRGWKGHRYRENERQMDDAAMLLQSAMRGHVSRRDRMRKLRSQMEDDTEDTTEMTESELDSAAETLQSSMRGHLQRREMIRRSKPPVPRRLDSDPEYDDAVTTLQSALRGHMARRGQTAKGYRSMSPKSPRHGQYKTRLDSEGEEVDDDLHSRYSSSKGTHKSSSTGSNRRKSPPRRSPVRDQDSEDDDDDIIVTSRSSRGKMF